MRRLAQVYEYVQQTDLSNPDDGGVHDGKVDLDVDAGDFGAPLAQIVDRTRSWRRFLVPGYAFASHSGADCVQVEVRSAQVRIRIAQWRRLCPGGGAQCLRNAFATHSGSYVAVDVDSEDLPLSISRETLLQNLVLFPREKVLEISKKSPS